MAELPTRGMSAEHLTKEYILEPMREAIQASPHRVPPGSTAFAKDWGVPKHKVAEHWENHSELITEAGGTPNQPKRKIPDEKLFRDYAKVCRAKAKFRLRRGFAF